MKSVILRGKNTLENFDLKNITFLALEKSLISGVIWNSMALIYLFLLFRY